MSLNGSNNETKSDGIDIFLLISLVQDRPCIWYKYHDEYTNKNVRRTSWLEIFRGLHEDYESLEAEEKMHYGALVQRKWTNLRDTFIKSMKPNRSQRNKKYINYDQLSFLLKNFESSEVEDNYFEYPPIEGGLQIPEKKTEKGKKRRRTRRRASQEDPEIQFVTECPPEFMQDAHYSADSKLFPENDDPRVMNEDEAFFASLLPTVVTYSIEERLEFRMEVLSVMKRINDKRSPSPPYE